jgi:hypothetical protein
MVYRNISNLLELQIKQLTSNPKHAFWGFPIAGTLDHILVQIVFFFSNFLRIITIIPRRNFKISSSASTIFCMDATSLCTCNCRLPYWHHQLHCALGCF